MARPLRAEAPRSDRKDMQGQDRKLCLDTRLMRGNTMKTFVLILAMLAAPLGAQNKQPQNTAPPQTAAQSASGQAAQQMQTAANSTTKPVQTQASQQLIVLTAEQLDEYNDKILNRSETFYNNRMTHLLWTMGIIMVAGLAIVGILIPVILELQRKRSFAKEMATRLQEFEEYTKEQTEKLRTELISQNDAREEEQTKAIGSHLAYIFTAMGGLFYPLKAWGMMLKSFFIAIRLSIDGQCFDTCFNISGPTIIRLLENPEITNSLTLDILCDSDKDIEDIKVRLDKITDIEQRVQMKSQIKDLQMTIHALIVEKRQGSDTVSPQTNPQEDERT